MIEALDFPKLPYGSIGTKHDLRLLAYKGGANYRRDLGRARMERKELGEMINDRLPLLRAFHDVITSMIVLGYSVVYIKKLLGIIKHFYEWGEQAKIDLTHENAVAGFYNYADYLALRVRAEKSIKYITARNELKALDYVLGKVLGFERGITKNTWFNSSQASSGTRKSDKTNLADVSRFGKALLSIVNTLTIEKIYGTLPIEITLPCGNVLVEYCGLRKPESTKLNSPEISEKSKNALLKARRRRADDHSPKTRHTVINLRIEAELLIFISQTSLNLAQAATMLTSKFRFETADDMINVYRVFKRRRQGEAEFTIFKAYREVFAKYLKWRDDIFGGDDNRLFPIWYSNAIPAGSDRRAFEILGRRLRPLGYTIYKAMALRSLRSNWLLRKTLDPGITAEMAQHTKETLFKHYAKPHHQTAAIEISRYLKFVDKPTDSSLIGLCESKSGPSANLNKISVLRPEPDCRNPAGCLFCIYHIDIDSQDYIWKLCTLRHLKKIELNNATPPHKASPSHPAREVADIINRKLAAYSQSSQKRADWLTESNDRILEGNYHPAFSAFIEIMELAS
ncbi:hypothetical protein [Pseudomonas sp. PS02290]|uniref:hypothetical protein n=1 Tax=Pseudomonas sp. PS02290 TaxID=2991430 RepID=UPI00249BC47F|nr:hypothetical protein [Pseudomonas sp. PS02290]